MVGRRWADLVYAPATRAACELLAIVHILAHHVVAGDGEGTARQAVHREVRGRVVLAAELVAHGARVGRLLREVEAAAVGGLRGVGVLQLGQRPAVHRLALVPVVALEGAVGLALHDEGPLARGVAADREAVVAEDLHRLRVPHVRHVGHRGVEHVDEVRRVAAEHGVAVLDACDAAVLAALQLLSLRAARVAVEREAVEAGVGHLVLEEELPVRPEGVRGLVGLAAEHGRAGARLRVGAVCRAVDAEFLVALSGAVGRMAPGARVGDRLVEDRPLPVRRRVGDARHRAAPDRLAPGRPSEGLVLLALDEIVVLPWEGGVQGVALQALVQDLVQVALLLVGHLQGRGLGVGQRGRRAAELARAGLLLAVVGLLVARGAVAPVVLDEVLAPADTAA
mmetsp:Transcript_115088/g.371966  ORF Transcript_115088/g.371966 Transcript_115088/m.371966 type:complete len:395 (-) Transcript_115088:2289-3473(-)